MVTIILFRFTIAVFLLQKKIMEAFELVPDPEDGKAFSLKKAKILENETISNKYVVTELKSETIPEYIERANFSVYFTQAPRLRSFPDLHGLKFLRILNLRWHLIRTFQCNQLPPKLEVLNLCHTDLETFPCLRTAVSLRELDLSQNKLMAISITDMPPNLEKLNLSWSNFQVCPLFDMCSKLKFLRMTHSNLSTFAENNSLPTLSVLDLSANEFITVPSLLYCSSLEECNLAFNKIRKIDSDRFPPSLKVLNLHSNRIGHITELPPNINSICLVNNPVQTFSREAFPNETVFDAISNGLTEKQKTGLLQPLPDDFRMGYDHVMTATEFSISKCK